MTRKRLALLLVLLALSSVHLVAHEPEESEQISFVDDQDQIWITHHDAKNRTQVTRKGRNRFPIWSPDGKRILFLSTRDEESGLYVINPNGKHEKKLARLKAGSFGIDHGSVRLLCSPDGSSVIFSGGDVIVVNVDGKDFGARNLSKELRVHISKPVWSPDSKHIAFVVHHEKGSSIGVAGIQGNELRRLTVESGQADNPLWSSTGNVIAFVDYREDNWGIFTVQPDRQNSRRIATFREIPENLAWSRSGTQMVCSSWVDEGDTRKCFVYLVDVKRPKVKRVMEADVLSIAWSPDDTRLAIEARKGGSNDTGLYLIDPDGTNKARVLEEGYRYGFSCNWSPDGKRILFGTRRAPFARITPEAERIWKSVGLYVIEINNKKVTRLTKGGHSASWRPNLAAGEK